MLMRTQLFLVENVHQKNNFLKVKNAHQEEESFSRLASYKHHDPQPQINYPHLAWPAWRIVFQVGIIKTFVKQTS